MKRKVFIIINPVSGVTEPILPVIARTFNNTFIDWEIGVTKKSGDAEYFAKHAIKKKYDVIAAYGGDGTITETARALHNVQMPLAILPGGSANVIAKELKIPPSLQEALNLLKEKKLRIKKIDMGLLGIQPIFLGYITGVWADIVSGTNRKLKAQYGQLAYGLKALQKLKDSQETSYDISINNKPSKRFNAAAIMVANVGNMGFEGVSLAPGVSVDDGYLDVMIMRSMEVKVISDWLSATIHHTNPKGTLKHFRCTSVSIRMKKKQLVLQDDVPVHTNSLSMKVSPESLTVIIPKETV